MLFSLVLLKVTGAQSYFKFFIFKASYKEFALFSTTFYMFSETLIMFYFIGSGTAIKNALVESTNRNGPGRGLAHAVNHPVLGSP